MAAFGIWMISKNEFGTKNTEFTPTRIPSGSGDTANRPVVESENPEPVHETVPAPHAIETSEPNALAHEEDLADWMAKQDWFIRLGESLPSGVRVAMLPQSVQDGWQEIELRESRQEGSAYDQGVAPLIGLLRVNVGRTEVEWLDPITDTWRAPQELVASRSLEVSPKKPSEGVESELHTPEMGSNERQAICDVARAYIRGSWGEEVRRMQFLFKVENLHVKGPAAYFEAYPIKPDGSFIESVFGDTVFTFLMVAEKGRWKVVLNLTRSDVPAPKEVKKIRAAIPNGFPREVLPDFWRAKLFP